MGFVWHKWDLAGPKLRELAGSHRPRSASPVRPWGQRLRARVEISEAVGEYACSPALLLLWLLSVWYFLLPWWELRAWLISETVREERAAGLEGCGLELPGFPRTPAMHALSPGS